jgi:hypothetical protein
MYCFVVSLSFPPLFVSILALVAWRRIFCDRTDTVPAVGGEQCDVQVMVRWFSLSQIARQAYGLWMYVWVAVDMLPL